MPRGAKPTRAATYPSGSKKIGRHAKTKTLTYTPTPSMRRHNSGGSRSSGGNSRGSRRSRSY